MSMTAKSNETGRRRETDSEDDGKNRRRRLSSSSFFVVVYVITVRYGQLWSFVVISYTGLMQFLLGPSHRA